MKLSCHGKDFSDRCVTPRSTSNPSQKRNRRASRTMTDNSSRAGATDRLQGGAQASWKWCCYSYAHTSPSTTSPIWSLARCAWVSGIRCLFPYFELPQHDFRRQTELCWGATLAPRTEMRAFVDVRVVEAQFRTWIDLRRPPRPTGFPLLSLHPESHVRCTCDVPLDTLSTRTLASGRGTWVGPPGICSAAVDAPARSEKE